MAKCRAELPQISGKITLNTASTGFIESSSVKESDA